MYVVTDIGLAVRVFLNGPGDHGSIPGRVIPKTQKMVLDASLLNTQHYKVRIKGKVEPSREGVAPSPTSWCSSYRKGSLRVTLDYGRQQLVYECLSSISFLADIKCVIIVYFNFFFFRGENIATKNNQFPIEYSRYYDLLQATIFSIIVDYYQESRLV